MSIVVHPWQRKLQPCSLSSDGLCLGGQPLPKGGGPTAIDVIPHKEQHLNAAKACFEEECCIGMSLPRERVHQIGYVPMPAKANCQRSDVILHSKQALMSES